MSLRICEECERHLLTQRKDARFCGPRCKTRWHNKRRSGGGPTDKRLQAASGAENKRRRPSRDGSGTKVYLTAEEVVLLGRLAGSVRGGGSPLVVKLRRATERIRRARPA